jgi:hypothetical protein
MAERVPRSQLDRSCVFLFARGEWGPTVSDRISHEEVVPWLPYVESA